MTGNGSRTVRRTAARGLGFWALGAAALMVALGGCAGSQDDGARDGGGSATLGDIEIADAWVRAAPAAANSAAYMILRNAGVGTDRLLSASSDVASLVEIHETRIEEGVAGMVHMPDGVEIPPGSSVALEPGGLHVMLTGLTGDLVEGATVAIDLQFENAGNVTVELPVRAAEAAGMDSGGG